jgi:hypothetical protein
VLTPTQKGSIAEAVIAAEAVKAGVNVLRPIAEGGRYDLVFEIAGCFFRVQCKSGKRRGDVVVVATRTCRHTPRGYVRTTYDAAEIGALAVYCPDTHSRYLLPIEMVVGRWEIRLRLAPARNNQEIAIKYAERFAFQGAIAQLGERVTGSHEVAGSSPASSTG